MGNSVTDILREQYNAAITQERDWDFFVNLARYLDYITETPILKKITDSVMKDKKTEFDKLAKLEEKTLKELNQAKYELLKIVEKNNISPDLLTPDLSSIPNPSYMNTLDTLKAFEKGRISITGFRSDNLEHFLFDIAASILKQGYKSELKDFLYTDEQYGAYYSEVNRGINIIRNEKGNFIFSKTLKLRKEQSEFIKNAKKFEIWGAFDKLFKFQTAFFEKSKNKNLDEILQKYAADARNSMETRDKIDVVSFAQDLEKITDIKYSYPPNHRDSPRYLKKDDFKNYASIANSYLIKELVKAENKNQDSENLRVKQQKQLEAIQGVAQKLAETNTTNTSESIEKREEGSLVGKPVFTEATSKIVWGGKECEIPPNTNQYIFCEKMFDIQLGNLVSYLDIKNSGEWDDTSENGVYDAMRAVNKKIENAFGVKNFFLWKKNYIQANTKLLKE